MIGKLDEHISYIKNFKSKDIDEIESLKIQFLGRKGIINDLDKLIIGLLTPFSSAAF